MWRRPAIPSPSSAAPIDVTATLNANDDAGIRAAVGKVVSVKGKVMNIGKTRSGSMFFINFTGNQRGQFVGIVKKENYSDVVAALGSDLKTALAGKSIELRGEIVLYEDTPEIVVSGGEQIRLIP